MRKIIQAAPRGVATAAAFATALLTMGALAGITPAAAGPAFAAQDRIIAGFCNGHPQANDCENWRYNRERWSNNQYQAFYRDHRSESDFNTAAAAADFGMLADPGAPVVGARIYATTDPGPSVRYVVRPEQVDATDPTWQMGVQTGNVEGNHPEIIGDSDNHVADCMATFKSYDVQTDSYFAFDGSRHRCKL